MTTTACDLRRTVPDILLKTLSIRVATSMAAGHLTTLQHQPRLVQNYHALGFFLLPSLPIATVFIDTVRAIYHSYLYSGSLSFFFSAALGQRAVERGGAGREDAKSWDLLSLNYDSLVRERGEYDVRWLSRLLALGAFLAQAIAAQRVAFGRMERGLEFLGTFDSWNALYLLGGTVAGVRCVVIHCCNWAWRCRRDPSLKRQEEIAQGEPSAGDMLFVKGGITPGRTVLEMVAALLMAQGFFVAGWLTFREILLTWMVVDARYTFGLIRAVNVLNLISSVGGSALIATSFLVPVLLLFPNLIERRRVASLTKFICVFSMWLTLWYMAFTFLHDLMNLSWCFDKRCQGLYWKDPNEGVLWSL
jgi:hypothetical protein